MASACEELLMTFFSCISPAADAVVAYLFVN